MTLQIRPGDSTTADRVRQQRAWNWYDWAAAALYTSVLTALFGPYMITVAGRAAGCTDLDSTCSRPVTVLGLHVAAGSLPSYLTSFATISCALLLPIVGALVDRSARKKWLMAACGWAGAACTGLLFFMHDDQWQLGAVAIIAASIFGGCSLVTYYAILVDISTEDERDSVSAHGWAWGYLGGGLLLAINLAMVEPHGPPGLGKELAVRLSLASAAVWWAAFTVIPVVRLRNYRPSAVTSSGTLFGRSFGQLMRTLRDLANYPQTRAFLIAYLFFNDGIQTVITSAATYGSKQLGMGVTVLIGTILMIQFVAFGGALFFGRLAARYGAYRPILWGTMFWLLIVVLAMFLPRGNVALFLGIGILIALVLGGTQALSRSFFSLLIPRGREGEYFALYQACERGTSWFGTFLFGLVFQLSGSYRPAIFALGIFFVLGAFFLTRVNPRRAIADAGNALPASMSR